MGCNKEINSESLHINNYFTVVDTGGYALNQLKYAILENREGFVDTIDLAFGIPQVENNQFLYIKVYSYAGAISLPHQLSANPGQYTLFAPPQNKKVLKKLSPGFDDYFSSPSVIQKKIYFWQLSKTDSSDVLYNISAAEYNPETSTTKQHFLFKDSVATDLREYFPAPVLSRAEIRFNFKKQNWNFNTDFLPIN